MFSYGSGLASSMFSLRITSDLSPKSPLHRLVKNLSDVKTNLQNRKKIAPQEFDQLMKLRETTCHRGKFLENLAMQIVKQLLPLQ